MTSDIHAQRILIIDFGGQTTQLIARRIREIGVYCEIMAYNISDSDIVMFNPSGIILSGGPESVAAVNSPRAPQMVFAIGCPVLGICYGMQTMAVQLGGKVELGHTREFGYAQIALREPDQLFLNIEDHITDEGLTLLDVWMSHGDQVSELPKRFRNIASTSSCPIVAMADDARHFYGIQFHPEVSHTRQGARILERFVIEICGCTATWKADSIIEDQIQKIKSTVGDEKVLLALSGGVDSAVAAVLLHQAIGDQLTCVFVDTGLLRVHEAQQVQAVFARHFGIQLITVHAKDRFFAALAGIDDPEQKRKVCGKLFIDIFEEQAEQLTNITWLAQGTIYSDVVESAATVTGKAHVIKSHHNVGGLPAEMQLKLIEPLRELFKDEVRKIGIALGLASENVNRHPFPGPGLAIRVLGEVKPEYVEKLKQADAILIDVLVKQNLYYQVSQAFAVFLPVKSVGVIGDARHYDHVISIRIVESNDFMTASWARLPYDVLDLIATRIINEVPGISRVTYDISNKPPATIEWE